MNTALWIVQSVMAIAFLFWGFMIAAQPREKVAEHGPWANDFSDQQVRVIGILNLLGGLGLVLPAVTGILPWMTPVAAAGLVLLLTGALVTQSRRKDFGSMALIAVFLIMALVVVYGRVFAVAIA